MAPLRLLTRPLLVRLAVLVLAWMFAARLTACSCGSSGGGGGGTDGGIGGPVTGGTFGTGDFKVTIAAGSIPPNAKAAPVAIAEPAVPQALPHKSYETNVTAKAKGYTLKIGGVGFHTSNVGSVRLEVPFDPAAVPDPTKLDSLHLILRILNGDDASTVDITGDIRGNKLVADLTGFPASATVAVLFNPNMRAVVSTTPATPARGAVGARSANATAWPTRHWVPVYDEADVRDAVETYLNKSPASSGEIDQAIRSQIADHAADAASTYAGLGFRPPLLYVSTSYTEVGGDALGSDPRYFIHYEVPSATYLPPGFPDPPAVVTTEKNFYGRIFIEKSSINRVRTTWGRTVYGVVAHELFHAVQFGYGFPWTPSTYGLLEGTATAHGHLLDVRHDGDSLARPPVRLWLSNPNPANGDLLWWAWNETFKLDDSLLSAENRYSNQDFFVYLARTIGNNDYVYLANFFEQIRLSTNDFADAALIRMYQGLDAALTGVHGRSLADVYGEFVRQRAMEHNEASRFGREWITEETEVGFAAGLFNRLSGVTGLPADVQVDPTSATPTVVSNLTPLAALSARAIRIRPVSGTSSGDLTITLTPSVGSFGTTLSGWAYVNNGPATKLDVSTVVKGFGSGGSDELVLLLINPSLDQDNVGVTCEIKGSKPQWAPQLCGQYSVYSFENQCGTLYQFHWSAFGFPDPNDLFDKRNVIACSVEGGGEVGANVESPSCTLVAPMNCECPISLPPHDYCIGQPVAGTYRVTATSLIAPGVSATATLFIVGTGETEIVSDCPK